MLAVTSGLQLLPSFDGPQFYPLSFPHDSVDPMLNFCITDPNLLLFIFFSLFSTKTSCVSDPTSISSVSDPRRRNRSVLQVVLSDICIPVETDSPTHTTSNLLTRTLTHRNDGSWRDHWMWHHHPFLVYAIQSFFFWLRPFFAPFHVIFAPFVIAWRATIFFIMNVLLSLWTLCFRSHSHVILCWMSSRHPVSLAI